MTAPLWRYRVAAGLLCLLGPLLAAGCDPFTVPDSAPHCQSAAPAPTPAPTPVALPGTVRFGTLINPNYTVHNPRVAFAVPQMVAWIAHFSHPIRTGRLHFEIWRMECGQWVRVYSGPNIPYAPRQTFHTRGILPALRLEYKIIQLGTYQVRYLNNGAVVARGTFILH
jgi:hypothetical protein